MKSGRREEGEGGSALSPFSLWAHDRARTVDERHMIWLLCVKGYWRWYHDQPEEARKGLPRPDLHFDTQRMLKYNPALAPAVSLEDTERTAEVAEGLSTLDFTTMSYDARSIRDAGALRFFPALETLKLGRTEVSDLSWLAALPRLRTLHLKSGELSDLSPLAGVKGLRHLTLHLAGATHPALAPPLLWPEAGALAALTELESLDYAMNAAVLEGMVFPRLRVASLTCTGQRDCLCLPEMPELRVLTLSGVESLRGISRYRRLRNLEIGGPLRDFGDLPALVELTSLTVSTQCGWPREVGPVAALPELRVAHFTGEVPRNYWPLAGAPKLRALEAPKAVGISLDVEAINAALSPWDVDFALPQRRPLPPLRIAAREKFHLVRPPDEPPHPDKVADPELFLRELLWMRDRCRKRLNELVGHTDGLDSSFLPCRSSTQRFFWLQIQSQDLALRLPEVIAILRECMADSPHEWWIQVWIFLRVPDHLFTPQQKRWLKQIEERYADRDDDFDSDRYEKSQAHLIETNYRKRNAEAEGEAMEPDDFVPPPEVGPMGQGPVEKVPVAAGGGADEDEETPEEYRLRSYEEQRRDAPEDGGPDDGGTKVEIYEDPPEWFWEDRNAHPLRDSYMMWGLLSLDLFCVDKRHAPTAMSLLGLSEMETIPEPEG